MMRNIFCSCLLFALGTISANAQLLVGDMNGDGSLDVSDITVIVSTILGETSRQYIYGDDIVIDNHEYVDLGLPSGTLWATTNIGANNPQEYGNYFSWGETEGYYEGKTTFDYNTYIWCNGAYYKLTKYCSYRSYGDNGYTDTLRELELADDAAFICWGSRWRIPSMDQWIELFSVNHTSTQWTTYNNTNGLMITSNINGKTLFLPAAGSRSNNTISYGGAGGGYWSRTLYADSPSSAWGVYFYVGGSGVNNYSRYIGYSIRPVLLKE